ncbi:MAG: hypothetical protein MK135_16890, partial [Polyangiaceae bacterium]|nr:hypothetical protein [Polyangiaceae bacterium]
MLLGAGCTYRWHRLLKSLRAGFLVLGGLGLVACAQPGDQKTARGEPETDLVKAITAKLGGPNVAAAESAITRMDLDEGELFLEGAVGPKAALARARLAIYRADCEGALSILASPQARRSRRAQSLYQLAQRCTGATVGARVIEDRERGVWLRLQDSADEALAPLLLDVAVAALKTLEVDLDVRLPRPLRIDLVRDLFSLSAVSGLPLEAA